MNEWILKGCKENLLNLSDKYNINPLMIKILLNRGVNISDIPEFLNNNFKLIDANKLSDMDKGIDIIISAIKSREKIRIVGDYDVDGVTATSILYKGLNELDANVDYIIPHRLKQGYGINVDIIKDAINDGVRSIITCDNGIAAFDALEYAHNNNIKLVLTDHHNLSINEEGATRLPLASAIINPKMNDYPFKDICGAMVAYKFIIKLADKLNLNLKCIEDITILASIGTVCDVMPLVNENRSIVKKGIELLKNTDNTAFKTIKKVFSIKDDFINTYTFGFVIGPAINSSGRLDDASISVNLLTTYDKDIAENLAQKLYEFNQIRQRMTNAGYDVAQEKLESYNLNKNPIIVLYLEDIHESLAGIIAGRIKEKYNRPTLIFTKNGDIAKGSARSIPEYDLFFNLSKIKDDFIKFGGHKLAAGFSAEIDKIPIIKEKLNSTFDLTEKELMKKIYIDSVLPIGYINLNLIDELSKLEPFGVGNEQPTFVATNVEIKDLRYIGKKKEHAKIKIQQKSNFIEAIYFNVVEETKVILESNKIVDIIYKLSVNEWNNKRTEQLIIEDIRYSKIQS